MVSINGQRSANGFGRRRFEIVLSVVYGVLSAANLVMMITEPTVWQGFFATVLLIAALWLWFDTQPRMTQ
jgi:nitrogen fixation protein FixH